MKTKDPRPIVAVIGAGATGAVTAWDLSQERDADGNFRYQVILIEKATPGNGSSQRSAACIRAQFTTEATVRGMRFACRYYDEFQEVHGLKETVYRKVGYLYPYANLDKFADAGGNNTRQRVWGLNNAQVLVGRELHQQFPFLAEKIIGATWCDTDGFLIPDLIYLTLVRRLREDADNATVMTNTQVVGARHKNDVITHLVVEDPRDPGKQKSDLAVDIIVDATNAWSPRLSELMGVPALPIEPHKRVLYFVKPKNVNVSCWPMVVTEKGAYCRPEGTDKFLMSWLKEVDPDHHFTDKCQDIIPPGFAGHDIDGHFVTVWEELSRWIPAIGEDNFVPTKPQETAGYYAMTPDANPIIDISQGTKNLIHAVGFSGHGLMHAPFSSKIVAHIVRQLMGEDVTFRLDGVDIDISSFKIDRDFSQVEKAVI
ncbi:MAG: FAD-binding oxidoreductase [Candidatus Magasanikbacteria bacterium]|nr:FAD-binding oxidoreductase [Candidatus Magasanikbacteria bacterium]NCS72288.1 FAD-binding oxidoreductase [Candidatus Magasanikbacteria bacterium]